MYRSTLTKQSSCNYKNETKGIYCAKHKLKEMIDIISKKCIFKNCDKIPLFNYKNNTKGIYCTKHKFDEMIDVKHKKCIFKNCDKQS